MWETELEEGEKVQTRSQNALNFFHSNACPGNEVDAMGVFVIIYSLSFDHSVYLAEKVHSVSNHSKTVHRFLFFNQFQQKRSCVKVVLF